MTSEPMVPSKRKTSPRNTGAGTNGAATRIGITTLILMDRIPTMNDKPYCLRERKYWDVGEHTIFNLSKDKCAKFLYALIACEGKIHDTHSLSLRDGKCHYNMKPHQIDCVMRISLPEGSEDRFTELVGEPILSEPPKINLN